MVVPSAASRPRPAHPAVDVDGALVGLDRCPVGTSTTLRRVEADRGQRRRLAELGFVPGTPISVLGRGTVKGLVLSVHEHTRVGVDRATARSLRVEAPAGAERG